MELNQTVYEKVPSRPWRVARYGISLASVVGGNGERIVETLNVAIAECIVKAVNSYQIGNKGEGHGFENK